MLHHTNRLGEVELLMCCRHLTICLAFQRGTGHASRTATRLATYADLLPVMDNTAATLQALTRKLGLDSG